MSLMDGKIHSASSLASENEVSTKTIHRSVDALLSAGVQVESKSGRFGGYYLNSSSIPQLLSIDSNQVAELLAVSSFKASILPSSNTLTSLQETLINSTPKENLKSALETSNKIILDSTTWGENNIDENKLNMLYGACINRNITEFEYTSYSGVVSQRVFYPYCLTLKNSTWYSYGLCKNSDKMKLFKLSRMSNIKLRSETFNTDTSIDLQTKPWNNLDSFNKSQISVRFKNRYLSEIKEWLKLDTILQNDIYYTATATVQVTDGLLNKLIQESNKIQVLKPQSLIKDILSKCKDIENLYTITNNHYA